MPIDKIFSTEKKSEGISDDDRKLMDDLQITPDSVRNPFPRTWWSPPGGPLKWYDLPHFLLQEHASANVFTGDEEVFAFQRAVSRLTEMQGTEYWQQWDKKAV